MYINSSSSLNKMPSSLAILDFLLQLLNTVKLFKLIAQAAGATDSHRIVALLSLAKLIFV